MLGLRRALESRIGHGAGVDNGRDVSNLALVHHLRGRYRATCLGVGQERPRRDIPQGLFDNPYGLFHLFHPHQKAVVVVPSGSDRDVKLESIVDGVRAIFAHVVLDASRAKERPGDAVGDRVVGGDLAGP